jgi:hypothetical protein
VGRDDDEVVFNGDFVIAYDDCPDSALAIVRA